MSYKKYFDQASVNSEQKDVIISQLKAELFDLKNSEKDYLVAEQKFRGLEQKY